VKIIYFAEFKKIAGRDTEKLDLKGNTIRDLIKMLLSKYKSMEELLWDNTTESIFNTVSVILNNKSIHSPHILSTSLKEGDEITFLFPISGG
jgi:MoaD family protein